MSSHKNKEPKEESKEETVLSQFPVFSKKDLAKTKEEVQSFRDHMATQAERIIQEIMPYKIAELNKLIHMDCRFSITNLSQITQVIPSEKEFADMTAPASTTTSSKKRKHEHSSDESSSSSSSDGEISFRNARIPINKPIMDLLELLKKEIQQLIDLVGIVKIWIQLNIPRIEDGNNFGVSVQEEIVGELSRAEDSGFAVLEAMTKYFVTRGKLLSKAVKYPYMEDYRQSIVELDEKEFLNLRLVTNDLRNNYAILYDLIHKNLDKIKQPRGEQRGALSMY